MTCRDNHDGTTTLTIMLTTADATACKNALDTETEVIITDAVSPEVTARYVIAEHDGIAAVRADAFVNLLTSPEPGAAKIEVLIDLDQLTSSADDGPAGGPSDGSTCETGGSRIAPEVARRLGCDAQISSLIEDSAGNPLSVGRETRVVPRQMRRALNRRDSNRCQFLGCDATYRLHAHHIIHWANGGPTELSNLVLVCNFHHHLLHEHGWTVKAIPSGGHTWITPSGDTATVKVFRGRHTDLRGPHTDPDLIHKLSGDTLQDLSWITTGLIHNELITKTNRSDRP